jgi:hypothetical protein
MNKQDLKKRNIAYFTMEAGLASQKEADEMYQESRNFVALIKEEIKKFSFA